MTAVTQYAAAHPGIGIAAATFTSQDSQTEYFDCQAESRFDLGSITKVFTALLLCEAVIEGLCRLEDPAEKHLAAPFPTYKGNVIALRHLATHTSALPRLPKEMYIRDVSSLQPYKDWDRNRLIKALGAMRLSRMPGSTYLYSNYGFGLLGAIVESIRGASYQQLVESLTDRLGCPGIRLFRPGDEPLTAKGKVIPRWEMAAFSPAGAATATLSDLVAFGRLALDPSRNPAIEMSLKPQGAFAVQKSLLRTPLKSLLSGRPSTQTMGLGWHYAGDIVWHNGGVAGFRSFLGLQPSTGRGVAILAAHEESVDALGMQALRSPD